MIGDVIARYRLGKVWYKDKYPVLEVVLHDRRGWERPIQYSGGTVYVDPGSLRELSGALTDFDGRPLPLGLEAQP